MKDELSQDAKTLLAAARASFSPDEPRISAVRAAIDLRIAAPLAQGSEGSLPGRAGTAVKGAVIPHVVAIGVFAAVTLAGGVGVLAWRHPPATHPVAAVAPRAPIETGARVQSPAQDAPAPAPSPPTVNAEALPTVEPPGVPPPAPPRRPRTPKKELQPAPDLAEKTPASSPHDSDDSLAREVSLLRTARSLLEGGDPEQALAVLRRHALLWPGGVLAEERLATQVLALCALGRVAEAGAAARELETVAPESPHLARVHASCAYRPGAAAP